ncbi:MAG: response regulator transcription factor [Pseudomonadota bacterium]
MLDRILIADDHDLVRETIAMFLASDGEMVVDQAATLDEALTFMKAQPGPDLILLDFNMPGMNGMTGLRRALDEAAGTPVAVISGVAQRETVDEAMELGAIGFLPKSMPAKSMKNAVRFMAAGETFLPLDYLRATENEAPHPFYDKLSKREIETLKCLCRGLSNKEVALELGIQEVTVKLHVKTLCQKLGAKNRTQAAMIARDEMFA